MRKKITRDAARAAGLKRYYTGKPCIHGHRAERYVAEPGSCVECYRLRNQRQRPLRQAYGRTPKGKDAEWRRSQSPLGRQRIWRRDHLHPAHIERAFRARLRKLG